jgi:rhodanese-related sulfurtransferase
MQPFDMIFGLSARLSAAESIVGFLHGVPSIDGERLASLIGKVPDRVVLLDVRSEEEFGVSRIEGALQTDPGTTPEQFRKRFPQGLEGKKVVAYCSIGERSAIFLERVGATCGEMGAEAALNLRGGIFRWRADGRKLVGPEGTTDRVHPYDRLWGTLLGPESSS